MINSNIPKTQSADPAAGKQESRTLKPWESPETIEIDLGNAETANTISNFDGTNYSS